MIPSNNIMKTGLGLVKRTILLCFILSLVCIFNSVATDTKQSSKDEIVLYGIYPTSGDLSEKGLEGKTAASVAVENMNDLYTKIGSDRVVTLNSTEISSDPESALSAVKSLHESGVNLIIGTLSSAQIEAIKPYADSKGVVIISTGSSARALTLPDDNIFRINPDDSYEEAVLNSLLKLENISSIVPLVREDSWSNFQNETILNRSMKSLGTDEVVRYDTGSTDYKDIVSRLDSLVGSVLEHEDKNSVAVMAFTFDDIIPIMEEASGSGYPNLSLVQWIGTDGNTYGQKILKSEKAANFADQRKFSGYTIKLIEDRPSAIHLQVKDKLGFDPDGYAFAAYDTAEVAEKVLALQGDNEVEHIKTAIKAITDNYYGVTGSLKLNPAGDKIRADYGFYRLEKDESGNFVWSSIGEWVKWNNAAPAEIRTSANTHFSNQIKPAP